jgi:hypothetical protein
MSLLSMTVYATSPPSTTSRRHVTANNTRSCPSHHHRQPPAAMSPSTNDRPMSKQQPLPSSRDVGTKFNNWGARRCKEDEKGSTEGREMGREMGRQGKGRGRGRQFVPPPSFFCRSGSQQGSVKTTCPLVQARLSCILYLAPPSSGGLHLEHTQTHIFVFNISGLQVNST